MLKAENIRVTFNGLNVLKGITIGIERGVAALIVGPNGSGKSTLFRAIMGIVDYSGSVSIDGKSLDSLSPHKRFELGITLAPEKMRVAENLSVKENIEVTGRFKDAVKLFPELEHLKNRKAGVLSGGERQLVVFSRAVLSNPSYLLFDEPFQGVSDENVDIMISIIEKQKKKAGIGIISHDKIEEVIEICDVLYFMLSGYVKRVIDIERPEDAIKKLEKYMIV